MRRLMLLPLLAITSACTALYDGKYDFNQGWRAAMVVKTGVGASLEPTVFDCRTKLASDIVAQTRFANVAYHSSKWLRHRIVPISEGASFQEGDRVIVNVRDCAAPLVLSAAQNVENP